MAQAQETLDTTLFSRDVSFDLSRPWTAYWTLGIRLITGYWFLHAGLTKLLEGGFSAGWWLGSAQSTIVGPIVAPFTAGIGLEFVNLMIPLGEFLIGLGVILGAMTRLASFFGAFLMFMFYFGNAEFAHGLVNGDLMGMMLFITVIVFGAGRIFGIDGYLESTDFVKRHSSLKYLLG